MSVPARCSDDLPNNRIHLKMQVFLPSLPLQYFFASSGFPAFTAQTLSPPSFAFLSQASASLLRFFRHFVTNAYPSTPAQEGSLFTTGCRVSARLQAPAATGSGFLPLWEGPHLFSDRKRKILNGTEYIRRKTGYRGRIRRGRQAPC